jgi:hypothetical protein
MSWGHNYITIMEGMQVPSRRLRSAGVPLRPYFLLLVVGFPLLLFLLVLFDRGVVHDLLKLQLRILLSLPTVCYSLLDDMMKIQLATVIAVLSALTGARPTDRAASCQATKDWMGWPSIKYAFIL